MKKITLLLFTLLSFIGYSQSWDFTNDAQGWTGTNSDLTVNTTSVTLTTKEVNNPSFNQVAAGVDAETNKFIAVTLKTSANGPSYMRASFPKAASGRVYKATAITKGTSGFKTYYIELTNGEWTGTVNDIKIQFKEDNSTTGGANYNTTGETIEIDKIEFLTEIPKEEKESFTFDADAEGWEALDATIAVSSGVLIITPTVGESSKIIQPLTNVNATTNKYVHIVYKNLSSVNNQIRFQFRHSADGYTGYKGKNTVISTSSSDFETATVDLSAVAEWTGTTQDFQIILRDTENSNKASAGDFEIDSITFSASATLSIAEQNVFNSFTMYPNPASTNVTFKASSTISKVQIFNLLGKKVVDTNSLINNILNIVNLNSGMYLVKVYSSKNKILTQKLIIK